MSALMIPAADLSAVPTAELRAELARGLALTAESLARLGTVWAELERRGENLSDLRRGLARALPLIAAGRLAAEAVVAFADRRAILRAIDGLPLAEQRRLSAGGTIEVVDPSDHRRTESVALAALPASRLSVVIDGGAVLSPAEQRVRIGRKYRHRDRDDADPDRRYRPRYDPAAGTVTVGRMTVRLADLLSELSAAAGPDHPPAADRPEDYLTVRVRLGADEHERLQAAAKAAGLPDWEMCRKALRAFGLM